MLAACTTQEQRTILTLARIGGLRSSEIFGLKWADVRWNINLLWTKSPKTEHHENKKGRFVPLWEPIRKELEAFYFCDDADGTDDRVFKNRNAMSNLRTRFDKIRIRAGLLPILKFFTNCRASRSTEVFTKYGPILESKWIGHSTGVAMRYYAQVRDVDIESAMREFAATAPKVPSNEKGDTFSEPKIGCPVFYGVSGQSRGDTIGDSKDWN